MPTIYDDDKTFNGACTFNGAATFAGGITFDDPATLDIGDGTGAPTLTIDKDGAEAGQIILKSDGVKRATVELTTGEALKLEVFNGTEVSQGSITIGADGNVAISGSLNVGGAATVPLRRYVSQAITQADFTGGSATQSIALTGEPTGMLPDKVYVVTDGGPVASSSGDTTGLSCEVGIASDPDLFMQSANLLGAAGRKEAYAGQGLHGYRAADPIEIKFTATGPAADLAHITGLSVRVVMVYNEVSAES